MPIHVVAGLSGRWRHQRDVRRGVVQQQAGVRLEAAARLYGMMVWQLTIVSTYKDKSTRFACTRSHLPLARRRRWGTG
jgi:hypothetical protein